MVKNSWFSRLFSLATTLVFVLQWVWPMPTTIALRNGILGLLLVLTLTATFANKPRLKLPHVSLGLMPFMIFGALTFWILIVGVLCADEPDLSRKEFVGQWLLPIGCAMVGWLLARWAMICGKQQTLIKTVFYAFFLAILLQNLMGFAYLLATDMQPFRKVFVLHIPFLFQGPGDFELWFRAVDGNFGEKFSFVNNMFVAFILAEAGQRILLHKSWLAISNTIILLGLVMSVLCSYWISFRNGNIGILSLLFFWGVMVVLAHKGRFGFTQKICVLMVLSIALSLIGVVFIKSDPRWQSFLGTAAVALEGDPQKAWLYRQNYPLLKDGQPVEGSAYERISWIKEGIKVSIKHPLGTGFNRNAFFDFLDRDLQLNGLVRGGHAHSGLVDFMVANGIPGVFLWVLFLSSCALVGWGMVRQGKVAQGLTVVFLVTGFFNRGLIDSNIRDHVLQQFLFLLTIYMTIQLAPVSHVKNSKTNHEVAA